MARGLEGNARTLSTMCSTPSVDKLPTKYFQHAEFVEVIVDGKAIFSTQTERSNNDQLPVNLEFKGLQPGMLTLSTALRTATGEKLITMFSSQLTPCLQSVISADQK